MSTNNCRLKKCRLTKRWWKSGLTNCSTLLVLKFYICLTTKLHNMKAAIFFHKKQLIQKVICWLISSYSRFLLRWLFQSRRFRICVGRSVAVDGEGDHADAGLIAPRARRSAEVPSYSTSQHRSRRIQMSSLHS